MFYIFSQDIADTYPHISIPQSSFICQDYLDFQDSALKIYAHVWSVTIMSLYAPGYKQLCAFHPLQTLIKLAEMVFMQPKYCTVFWLLMQARQRPMINRKKTI